MSNLAQFNRCSAALLATLYRTFPLARDITVGELEGHSGGAFSDDIFFASIEFLSEERYLRFKRRTYQGFEGAVLSARGLNALNQRPCADAPPIGETLASRDAEVDQLIALVLDRADH
jgi:hypothetical protein